MSGDHTIKNLVQLEGTVEDVEKVIKEIRSENNLFDFNLINPINKNEEDVEMNDYINACLNVYMLQNQVDQERFIKTCTFVGRTREVPYEFKVLTQTELNCVRSRNKTEKMIKDAEFFLDKIKSKAIFNGYMIRETAWGTGSGAANVQIKNNQIRFDTYNLPPIKVIEKLAKKYPKVRVIYSYTVGNILNRVLIKGEYKKEIIKNVIPEILSYTLITENVSL